ncbi:MAG TPA: peptidoglycan recognition family protein, partial [Bryobacteraceae bacterium]|nr:peptidoglycan recognition family protein [Bryobacteraceae bacterium]
PSEAWSSEPVGIVFHTTESHQAQFTAEQNQQLKRITNGLLDGVKERQSYNFVIDRFGRVFRVVEESNAANHSGNSVWADEEHAYINLNHSFLGVSFEAQSGGEPGRLTGAQIHSGRILTDYLRAKYKLPTTNCITHAQVSVNPSNMLIGYHTDWAQGFPFEEIGLPNNYAIPVPALINFGFEHDASFRKTMGDRVWPGIGLAEQQFVKNAIQSGRTLGSHRATLQERYRKLYSTLRQTGALDESFNVTSNSQ